MVFVPTEWSNYDAEGYEVDRRMEKFRMIVAKEEEA